MNISKKRKESNVQTIMYHYRARKIGKSINYSKVMENFKKMNMEMSKAIRVKSIKKIFNI